MTKPENVPSMLFLKELTKGTTGKTSHDKATITTTWGTRIPNDGNNISTGSSVIVLEPD
jgi:hypothetical protein